jgi:hypothetical protein
MSIDGGLLSRKSAVWQTVASTSARVEEVICVACISLCRH